jgi:hypothetical protein
VLVTKLPVPGTSDLPSEEKAEYIRQQSNGQYAQASTMEATVCILAALANNEHVFGPELREYTECRETIESHPIRVGASLQGTLNYTYPLYSPIRCGAAAARIA